MVLDYLRKIQIISEVGSQDCEWGAHYNKLDGSVLFKPWNHPKQTLKCKTPSHNFAAPHRFGNGTELPTTSLSFLNTPLIPPCHSILLKSQNTKHKQQLLGTEVKKWMNFIACAVMCFLLGCQSSGTWGSSTLTLGPLHDTVLREGSLYPWGPAWDLAWWEFRHKSNRLSPSFTVTVSALPSR